MYWLAVTFLAVAVYSFIGWVAEVLLVLAQTQKLSNRGFLSGPFLPIYGVGSLAILAAVTVTTMNPFVVFVASVVIASVLEFVTHLFLEKVFHIRLWDYRAEPLNLHGRICLRNSLAFGALALLLVYVLQPAFAVVVDHMPHTLVIALAGVLLGILLVDLTNSTLGLAQLRPQLDAIEGSLAETHDLIEEGAGRVHDGLAELSARNRATVARLARVFPHARSTGRPRSKS